MSLTRRLSSAALSTAAGALAALLAVGLTGDYMAWVFGAVWAGIAVPLAGLATLIWHPLAVRCITWEIGHHGGRGSPSRGIGWTLTGVLAVSLLLGGTSGYVIEWSVGPPIGLSLLSGGVVYVPSFLRWYEAAPPNPP